MDANVGHPDLGGDRPQRRPLLPPRLDPGITLAEGIPPSDGGARLFVHLPSLVRIGLLWWMPLSVEDAPIDRGAAGRMWL